MASIDSFKAFCPFDWVNCVVQKLRGAFYMGWEGPTCLLQKSSKHGLRGRGTFYLACILHHCRVWNKSKIALLLRGSQMAWSLEQIGWAGSFGGEV